MEDDSLVYVQSKGLWGRWPCGAILHCRMEVWYGYSLRDCEEGVHVEIYLTMNSLGYFEEGGHMEKYLTGG